MYTGVAPRKKCKVKIAKTNEYAIKEVIRSTIKNLSDKYTKVKLIKIERRYKI